MEPDHLIDYLEHSDLRYFGDWIFVGDEGRFLRYPAKDDSSPLSKPGRPKSRVPAESCRTFCAWTSIFLAVRTEIGT